MGENGEDEDHSRDEPFLRDENGKGKEREDGKSGNGAGGQVDISDIDLQELGDLVDIGYANNSRTTGTNSPFDPGDIDLEKLVSEMNQ